MCDTERVKSSNRCFCAFCKTERIIYRKRHLSALDAFLAVGAAFMMMLVIWQDFDPRVLVFIALALVSTEAFVMTRWRLAISCRHCGFDPALYRRDREHAARKVKEHMARRREDPMTVFSPTLNLHVLKKKPSQAMRTHEGIDLHPDL